MYKKNVHKNSNSISLSSGHNYIPHTYLPILANDSNNNDNTYHLFHSVRSGKRNPLDTKTAVPWSDQTRPALICPRSPLKFPFWIPKPLVNPIYHARVLHTGLFFCFDAAYCRRKASGMTFTGPLPEGEIVHDHRASWELHVLKMRMLGHDVQEIGQLDPEDVLQCEEFGPGFVV